MTQYIQNIFYHYILSDAGMAMKVDPDFFDAKNLQVCFTYAKEYVLKYHSAPSSTQLKELLRMADKTEMISDDIVDIIYSAEGSLKDYANDWLFDNATSWAQWKNFLSSLRNTLAYVKLNQDNVTTENVKEIMERAKGTFNKNCILEFADDGSSGSDFWDALSHKQVKLVRSSSGYPFIDLCLKGGYFPGCLICFVGAPKVGKSLWMQNLTAASVKKGENCCYVSLELPEEMIHNRIGSNMFSIPSLNYEKYAEDEGAFKERIKAFKKGCLILPGQLIVKSFPTSTMSVLDLEAYLLSKEEELSTETKKFKFKNIFVDYINIMKNYRNPNSENTYMKIKQLAEDLKALGIKHNWAIITATQTTRSQYDTNDMSAAQVSESVGLGATVDAMFGIIADAMMKAQGKYYLKCLYDRVAPEDNKRKLFNNDKEFLRITEDANSPIEEVTEMQRSAESFKNFTAKNNPDWSKGKFVPNQTTGTVPPGSIADSVPLLSETLEKEKGVKMPDTTSDLFKSNLINVTGKSIF